MNRGETILSRFECSLPVLSSVAPEATFLRSVPFPIHNIQLGERAKRAYYSVIPSRGRWLAMEAFDDGSCFAWGIRRLAIKLREDLINGEEKLGPHESLPSSWILPAP